MKYNEKINNYYIYVYLDTRKIGQYCYDNICFLYKPFYIGKGKDRRLENIKDGRSNDFIDIINEIKKYGLEQIIIKLYENLNEKQSFELETKLINEIGRIDLETGPLINRTSGGQGKSGNIVSEETKELIAKKQRKNFQNIKKEFERRDYILLTEEKDYKNANDTKLEYECPKGHKGFTDWCHFQRGRGCPICDDKLDEIDIIHIKLFLETGILNQQEIADIFDVDQSTISKIKTGKLWNYIEI